jgi:hypothetical protein
MATTAAGAGAKAKAAARAKENAPAAKKPRVREAVVAPKPKGTAARKPASAKSAPAPERVLVIDIGGSNVKLLVSGETEPRKLASGPKFTPAALVEAVKTVAKGWRFDAVSIGFPGLVGADGPRSEPGNLGPGWVGFNFAVALDRPVRMINDAAMQALGSYDGGRMLFLGLGTGLGSTLIAQNVIIPLELGELAWDGDHALGELLGREGLAKLGKSEVRELVYEVALIMKAAFIVEYVVLGGGNAKLLKKPPGGVRLGNNHAAFRGGFRLWKLPDVPTLSPDAQHSEGGSPGRWRVI